VEHASGGQQARETAKHHDLNSRNIGAHLPVTATCVRRPRFVSVKNDGGQNAESDRQKSVAERVVQPFARSPNAPLDRLTKPINHSLKILMIVHIIPLTSTAMDG
jgi:hypothetical protein